MNCNSMNCSMLIVKFSVLYLIIIVLYDVKDWNKYLDYV